MASPAEYYAVRQQVEASPGLEVLAPQSLWLLSPLNVATPRRKLPYGNKENLTYSKLKVKITL